MSEVAAFHQPFVLKVANVYFYGNRISRVVLFVILAFAANVWAAEDERQCGSEIYAAIERDLRIAGFAERARDEGKGFVVSEACKTWPYKPELTLVALAYDAGVEYEKELVVAVFDKKRKHVVHSYQQRIQEDWLTEVGEYSLGFDTARYQLADNVRAFGLSFNSSARGPSCAEAGWGDQLILLVPEGKSLRQVLSLYKLQGRSNKGGCGPDSDWKQAYISISIEKTQANGFYDLRVTATTEAATTEGHVEHATFRYNGKRYEYEPIIPWWLNFQNAPLGQ
jgi:hypothetical protein